MGKITPFVFALGLGVFALWPVKATPEQLADYCQRIEEYRLDRASDCLKRYQEGTVTDAMVTYVYRP